jgi:Dolichyl-phosphate-mannose-protein mannosyltransferase
VNSGLAWLVGLALCLPSRRLLLDRAPWLERSLAWLGRALRRWSGRVPRPGLLVWLGFRSGEPVRAGRPRFVRVSWRWVGGAGAALVLLTGGVLACLWRLGTPTWGGDEPVYAQAGHDYLRGEYTYNPEHPPLVKYLIGVAQNVFGGTITGNRVPSALALLAAGILAWRWLRRVGPRGAGPVAAIAIWTLPVLAAFPEVMSPQSLAPDREAMLEPVAAVLALGAVAAGWWWARSGRWIAVPISGVLAGLAVAAKLPALFAVGVAALAGCVGALARRPTPRRLGRPRRRTRSAGAATVSRPVARPRRRARWIGRIGTEVGRPGPAARLVGMGTTGRRVGRLGPLARRVGRLGPVARMFGPGRTPRRVGRTGRVPRWVGVVTGVPRRVGVLTGVPRRDGRTGRTSRWVGVATGMLRRVGRSFGQGVLWLVAGAAGFAACYAPMGWDGAVDNIRRGWDFQTWHGEIGHPVLVHGAVTRHAPWWVLLDWQSASWGTPLVAVAIACLVGGLVTRPLLVGYLTAAWAVPATLLVPLTGLALPHYPLLWRPTLIAAVAVGGCATVQALWRDGRRRANRLGLAAVATAAALAVTAAIPAGLVASRSAYRLATLRPTSYAALPTAVTDPGAVWMIGDLRAARYYLPDRPVVAYALPRPHPLTGHPAAVILDRDTTLRLGDWGAAIWAAAHGYHLHRSDSLDIWLPDTAVAPGTAPPATFGTARGTEQAPPPAGALIGGRKPRPGKRRL